MTSTRPYELLARFAADGTVAGVSVRTITTVNGRDYESDPMPLSGTEDPAFVDFAKQFAAAGIAERDEEKAALATMTTDRDSQKAIADTVPGLQDQIESLTAEKATLTSEVERLTALVPTPLPERSIYPRELLGRLTRAEVIAALRSDDDDVIFAVANLQTTVSPVLLDSEETRMLIGSLVLAGILTPERMSEVLQ